MFFLGNKKLISAIRPQQIKKVKEKRRIFCFGHYVIPADAGIPWIGYGH
jgi:hypothetical protein